MSEMTTHVGKIRKLIEEGAPDAYNFLFTFYNGGTCFSEMLTDAIEKEKKS